MKKVFLAMVLSSAFAMMGTAWADGNTTKPAEKPASDVPTQAVYSKPANFASQTLSLFQQLLQYQDQAQQLHKGYGDLFQAVQSLTDAILSQSKDEALKNKAQDWTTRLGTINKATDAAHQRAQKLLQAQIKTMSDVSSTTIAALQNKGLPVYLADIDYQKVFELQKILKEMSESTPSMTQGMYQKFQSASAELDKLLKVYPGFYKMLRSIDPKLPEDAKTWTQAQNDALSVSVFYTLASALDKLNVPEIALAQASAVLRQYHNAFADSSFKALDLLPQIDGPFARSYGMYLRTPGDGVSINLTQLMAGSNWTVTPNFSVGLAADTAIQSSLKCNFCHLDNDYDAVTAGVSAFAQYEQAHAFAKVYANWRHYDLGAADNTNIDLMEVRLPGAQGDFGAFKNPTPAKAWSAEALVQVGYNWMITPALSLRPKLSYQWSTLRFKDLPKQNRQLIDAQVSFNVMPRPHLWLGLQLGAGQVLYSASQEANPAFLPITNPKADLQSQPELLAKRELRMHGALTLRWKANLVSHFNLMVGGEYYNKSKAKALYYQVQYQYQF